MGAVSCGAPCQPSLSGPWWCGMLQLLCWRWLCAGNLPEPDESPPAPPDTSPHPLPKAQEVWWLVRCSRTAAGNEDLVDGNVLRAVGVCHLVYSR